MNNNEIGPDIAAEHIGAITTHGKDRITLAEALFGVAEPFFLNGWKKADLARTTSPLDFLRRAAMCMDQGQYNNVALAIIDKIDQAEREME